MPKLQAAVPVGAPPNALLCVRLPDGKEVNVRVLEGLQPGDEFIFGCRPWAIRSHHHPPVGGGGRMRE